MFLFFWRTIQLLHINFFTNVIGVSLRGTSLESPFHSIFLSAESHFEVFWGWFRVMFLYVSRAIPSFCTVYFCITLTFNGLRNVLLHLCLCLAGGERGGGSFFACCGYIQSYLEKDKTLCFRLPASGNFGSFWSIF